MENPGSDLNQVISVFLSYININTSVFVLFTSTCVFHVAQVSYRSSSCCICIPAIRKKKRKEKSTLPRLKGASWKMHTSLTLTSHYPGFSHMTIPIHKGGWGILSVPRDHMLRKNGKADKGRKDIHSTISTICHRKTNEDVYY